MLDLSVVLRPARTAKRGRSAVLFAPRNKMVSPPMLPFCGGLKHSRELMHMGLFSEDIFIKDRLIIPTKCYKQVLNGVF
jgi:hypothetical protein